MTITAPLDLCAARWIIRIAVATIGVVCLINYVVGKREAATFSDRSDRPSIPNRYRWLSLMASFVLILFGGVMFWQPRSEKSFPVVASILVIWQLGTSVFAGLAFWADRYRIPVLTIALAFITLTNLRGLDVLSDLANLFVAMNPGVSRIWFQGCRTEVGNLQRRCRQLHFLTSAFN
jgi:hypothetical protein